MSCPVREACPSARTMSGSRRLSPVRRLAPTVPPTSASTRCRRAPAGRQLLRPSYRLRLTKIRACSPSFSGSPICCAPTRRRLPAKLLVRLCRSGRRRLKQRISKIENCRARQWRSTHVILPRRSTDQRVLRQLRQLRQPPIRDFAITNDRVQFQPGASLSDCSHPLRCSESERDVILIIRLPVRLHG